MTNLTMRIMMLAETALTFFYFYLIINLAISTVKNKGKIPEDDYPEEHNDEDKKLFKVKRNDVIQHITKDEKKLKYYAYYAKKISEAIGKGPYRIYAVRKMNHTVNDCKQEVLVECFIKGEWKILKKNHFNDFNNDEHWIQGWIFSS